MSPDEPRRPHFLEGAVQELGLDPSWERILYPSNFMVESLPTAQHLPTQWFFRQGLVQTASTRYRTTP